MIFLLIGSKQARQAFHESLDHDVAEANKPPLGKLDVLQHMTVTRLVTVVTIEDTIVTLRNVDDEHLEKIFKNGIGSDVSALIFVSATDEIREKVLRKNIHEIPHISCTELPGDCIERMRKDVVARNTEIEMNRLTLHASGKSQRKKLFSWPGIFSRPREDERKSLLHNDRHDDQISCRPYS